MGRRILMMFATAVLLACLAQSDEVLQTTEAGLVGDGIGGISSVSDEVEESPTINPEQKGKQNNKDNRKDGFMDSQEILDEFGTDAGELMEKYGGDSQEMNDDDEDERKEKMKKMAKKLYKLKGRMGNLGQEKFEQLMAKPDLDFDKFGSDETADLIEELTELPDDIEERLMNIAKNPQAITADDIKMMPLRILSIVKKNALKQLVSNLNDQQETELCKRMFQEMVPASMFKKLMRQGLSCDTEFEIEGMNNNSGIINKQMKDALEDARKAFACMKLKNKNPEEFDDGDVQLMSINPDCVDSDIFEKMPIAALQRNAHILGKMGRLPPRAKMSMKNRMKQRLGKSLRLANKDDLAEIAPVFNYLEVDEVMDLDEDAVQENAEAFCESLEKDAKSTIIMQKIFKSMKKGNVDAAMLQRTKKCLKKAKRRDLMGLNIGANDFADMMDEDDEFDDEASRDQMAEKLMDADDFKDKTFLNPEKMRKYKKVLCGLKPLDLAAVINPTDLWSNMGSFNRLRRCGRAQKMVFLQKAFEAMGDAEMDCDKLKKLGNFMGVMSTDQLERIGDDVIAECLESDNMLEDLEIDDAVEIRMAKAFKRKNKNLAKFSPQVFQMGKLFKHFSLADIKNKMPIEQMLNSTNFTLNVETTPVQSSALLEKVKSQRKFSEWRVSDWKNFKTVIKSVRLSDIKDIEPNSELFDQFSAIVEEFNEFTDEQNEVFAEKIEDYLDLDNIDQVSDDDFSEVELYQVGPFLSYLVNQIHKFPQALIPKIFEKIGEQDFRKIPFGRCKRLAILALKYVLRGTVVEDRSEVGELDSDDLLSLGNLKCCLPFKIIQRLNAQALLDNAENLQCLRERKSAEDFLEKYKESYQDWETSPEHIANLASLHRFSDDSDIKKIDNDALSSVVESVMDGLETATEFTRDRIEEGFKTEIPETDLMAEQAGMSSLVEEVVESLLESKEAPVRRRRRSNHPLSCTDMKTLKSGVTAVTPEHLNNMDDSEFLNCLETFGIQSNWSADHLSAMATKTKLAMGAVMNIGPEILPMLGSIAAGFSAAEIAQLNLTLEALGSLGTHDLYAADQLSAGFDKWLTVRKSSNAGNVSGDELTTMKNFACGANPTQISAMPHTAYSEAAASIGQLMSCSEAQMAAYRSKADEAWGNPISSWPPSQIQAFGSLIGGVAGNDLSSFTADQIQSISANHISSISPQNFKSFTASQLENFGVAQALSITTEQTSQLGTEQMDSLKQILEITMVEQTSPGKGNNMNGLTFLLVLMTAVTIFLRL